MNIFSWFRRKYPRKALVHCSSGDIVLKVSRKGIIKVPWMLCSYCPFRLEPDGKVTLRLMWGTVPSAGYGKVWDGITWEPIKGDIGNVG